MNTIKKAAIALSTTFALTACEAPEDNKPTYVAPTTNQQAILKELARKATEQGQQDAIEICASQKAPADYRSCFEESFTKFSNINAVLLCSQTTACDTEKLIASIKDQDHEDHGNAPTITP